MSQYGLFGIPYTCLDLTEEIEDELSLGTGIGKTAGSDVLYAISVEPGGILAVGRTDPDTVPVLIEDILLFHSAAQNFFAHPSRLGSGKDGFCIQDHETSESESK